MTQRYAKHSLAVSGIVGLTPGEVTIKWLLLRRVTVGGQVNHLGITNTKVNSAFHPSRVGKSITSLSGWVATNIV